MNSCFFVLIGFLQHFQFQIYQGESKIGWFETKERFTTLRTWVHTPDGGTHLIIGGESLKKKYGKPHGVCEEKGGTLGVWILEKQKGNFK